MEVQDLSQRGTGYTQSEPGCTHVGILLICWKRSIMLLFKRKVKNKTKAEIGIKPLGQDLDETQVSSTSYRHPPSSSRSHATCWQMHHMPAITEQQHKTPLNTTKQMTSVTGEKFTLKSSMLLERFLLLFCVQKNSAKKAPTFNRKWLRTSWLEVGYFNQYFNLRACRTANSSFWRLLIHFSSLKGSIHFSFN